MVWDLKFCATEDEVGSSASRFGNILPLWQYFDGFCSIWQNVWTYLAIIYAIGRIVFFVNVQILKKLSSHLVTLAWCSLVEFWSLSAIPDGQFSILAIVYNNWPLLIRLFDKKVIPLVAVYFQGKALRVHSQLKTLLCFVYLRSGQWTTLFAAI